MGHGQGAQGVLGGLDEGVFEGVVVMGWVGDDLQHNDFPFRCGHLSAVKQRVAAVRGLTDRRKS